MKHLEQRTPFLENGENDRTKHWENGDPATNMKLLENGTNSTKGANGMEMGSLGTSKASVTIQTNDDDEAAVIERGVWSNKLQFFLAIMGYTIGIGSVWRFPIICR